MQRQDPKSDDSVQQIFAQQLEQVRNNIKVENNEMSADIILHEASTVLQAALQHASELKEVGVTENELHLMRVLIARVAAHNYTSLGNKVDFTVEVHELKVIKEVIFRTAEMRFGRSSKVLSEFRYAAKHNLAV